MVERLVIPLLILIYCEYLAMFQWKKSVQDIGGEVLCGKYALNFEISLTNQANWYSSVTIYFTCLNKERQQTRLSQICRTGKGKGALFCILCESSGALREGKSKRWSFSSHDGCGSCQ